MGSYLNTFCSDSNKNELWSITETPIEGGRGVLATMAFRNFLKKGDFSLWSFGQIFSPPPPSWLKSYRRLWFIDIHYWNCPLDTCLRKPKAKRSLWEYSGWMDFMEGHERMCLWKILWGYSSAFVPHIKGIHLYLPSTLWAEFLSQCEDISLIIWFSSPD